MHIKTGFFSSNKINNEAKSKYYTSLMIAMLLNKNDTLKDINETSKLTPIMHNIYWSSISHAECAIQT